MDLGLNQAALASSREVFYEGSERPRSVLDECWMSDWLYLCDIHHTIAAMNMSHMTHMTCMEVELDLLCGC